MLEDKVKRLTRWQRIGIAGLMILGVLGAGGAVFVVSGVYNIAASREHWSLTNVIITILRDRSIAVAASDIEVPQLDDADLYRLGAEHFRTGCTSCHGVPGHLLNPVYTHMLPQPPDLSDAFEDYDAQEVFWIIKNGLKYTGMPAWPGEDRPDEVWSVVAFLARLNREGPEDLAAMDMALPGKAEGGCARCHGDAETAPVSDLVPVLHGQKAEYLARALREYRSGARDSGIMEPLAHALTDDEIERLAGYYAGLPQLSHADEVNPERAARGREIASTGIPERDVPACESCHGGSNSNVPSLEGQPQDYLATQLRLWTEPPSRTAPPYGSLMAEIGRRLAADDIDAVSAYFASTARRGDRP